MVSDKQKQIMAFPYSKYSALICDGSIRSGKTSIMTVAFVDWAMREFAGQRFGICGKTVDSATKNIIDPYKALAYAKKRYSIRWKRTEKVMEVTYRGTTNIFEVFGGKDESSYALIQGRTLAGVLLDEVALMPRSFVEQALARCSVTGAKMWFNCNPGPPTHWFYKEWIKDAESKNALRLRFQLEDNPGLSQDTINQYRRNYNGIFYDRYIRGMWVRAEGVIYKNFADNPQAFAISRDIAKQAVLTSRYLTVGVDFGGNKSAHTFVAVLINRDWSVIALRSHRMPAHGTSVDDLIRQFTAFCNDIDTDYGKIDSVWADCAEQAIINTMQARTKWNVMGSIKGEIIDRIRATDIMLNAGRLHYVDSECDTLKSALSDAVWDDDKMDCVRLDDGTSDIDTLDAFEYSWSWAIKQIVRE